MLLALLAFFAPRIKSSMIKQIYARMFPKNNYPQAALQERLINHEGVKKNAYQDSLGFWTIGVGRCIDARKSEGLSLDEIMYLLRNDIDKATKQLTSCDWFVTLDKVRQDVCVEMVFNVGFNGFLGFKKTIAAITLHDFNLAAKCLADSKWATQVSPSRVRDVVYRMEYGKYLSPEWSSNNANPKTSKS